MNMQRLKDMVDNAYMACSHSRVTDVKVLVGKEVLDIFDVKVEGDNVYLHTNFDSEMLKHTGDKEYVPYINILANMINLRFNEGVDMLLPNDFGDYLVHNRYSLVEGTSITLCVSPCEAERILAMNSGDFFVDNGKVFTSKKLDVIKEKYTIPKGIYVALMEFLKVVK